MIDVVIMKPLNLADNSLELESQALWNCPAACVVRRAFDGNSIELPGIEAVSDEGPAACSHDALALMSCIQPVAQRRPAVWPIDIQMVEDPLTSGTWPQPGPCPPGSF